MNILLSITIKLLGSLIQVFLTISLLIAFYKYKNEYKRYIVVVCSIETLLLMIVYILFEKYFIIQALLSFIFLMVFAYFFLEEKILRKMFFILGEIAVSGILQYSNWVYLNKYLHNKGLAELKYFNPVYVISSCVWQLFSMILYLVILCFFKKIFYLQKNQKQVISVYFFSSMSIYIVLLYWNINYDNTIVEKNIASIISIIILISSIMICHIIYIISVMNMNEIHNRFLEFRVEKQKNAILALERDYENIRIMKHDINRQLTLYLMMLEDGKSNEVIDHLRIQLNESVPHRYVYIKNNKLISAVLSEKKDYCINNGISFRYSISTIINSAKEMDIAVLLSNTLDNAIDAESGLKNERSILLYIFDSKGNTNIIVKNRIESSVLKNNPNLNTNKLNDKIHGYGLKSIAATIEKYSGTYQIFEENGYFLIHIMFPI